MSRKKLGKQNALLPKGCNLLEANSAEQGHAGKPCARPGSTRLPSSRAGTWRDSSELPAHPPQEDTAATATPASDPAL